MAQAKRHNGSDFNPDELVQANDQHARNIEQLRVDLQSVQSYMWPIQGHENFATYFQQVAASSKVIDSTLSDIVKELIINDKAVRSAIKQEVAATDRAWWNSAAKKGLTAVGAVLLVILGAVIQGILSKS